MDVYCKVATFIKYDVLRNFKLYNLIVKIKFLDYCN